MERQLSVTFPESLANSLKLGDKEFENEMQQKGIWINNELKLKVLKKVNEESEQN